MREKTAVIPQLSIMIFAIDRLALIPHCVLHSDFHYVRSVQIQTTAYRDFYSRKL